MVFLAGMMVGALVMLVAFGVLLRAAEARGQRRRGELDLSWAAARGELPDWNWPAPPETARDGPLFPVESTGRP